MFHEGDDDDHEGTFRYLYRGFKVSHFVRSSQLAYQVRNTRMGFILKIGKF